MRIISLLVSVALFGFAFREAQPSHADLLLVNAKIWTVDPRHPVAEAVAVQSGRIKAVGKSADLASLAGPQTRVIDCEGKLVLPGFIDNHTHFMSGGFQLQSIDLRQAVSPSQFASLIRERVRLHPGRWITGGDWDHDRWPGGPLPTKALIDSFTQATPVFVTRYDGHMGLANSLVLARAGITRDTPDPPGGTIVRDPLTGEPTGVLKDEAMGYVWGLIPDPVEEEMIDAVRVALAEARRFGVTSIQDVSTTTDVRIYRLLRDRGELTARFHCRLPLGSWSELANAGIRVPSGDTWVRIGSLKAFADGSLGSTTALFCEPYRSDPTTCGLPSDILLDGRLEQWARAADSAHLQLSIHAIGDSANRLVLDMLERIARNNPPWDRRFRIEHAQHIRPADIPRFHALGVVPSVQPYHAIDDGRWAEGRIGKDRCRTAYPFRGFLASQAMLSFGSDWTVAPLNPLLGIYAAVTRRTTDGKNPGGWFPEQRITVEEAIKAYTINNAWAAFEENEKGSITPGKLADMVILSDDILTLDPARIERTTVATTIVGGTVVYRENGGRTTRRSHD